MSYKKGATSERELSKLLWLGGFAIVRSAGSAHLSYSAPDIIAIKNGEPLAFECKARKGYVYFRKNELSELKKWCETAGCKGYLAWKIKRKGWYFLSIDKINFIKKIGITEEFMLSNGSQLGDLLTNVSCTQS